MERNESNEALGIVMLGGVGGKRRNCSKDMLSHIETYISITNLFWKHLVNMSKEHVVTLAQPLALQHLTCFFCLLHINPYAQHKILMFNIQTTW